MVFQRKMKKYWFMGAFLLIVLLDPAMGPKQEIVMEKTKIIPKNKQEYTEFTKNINCSKGTYPQYAVSSRTYNETYIVCWKKITIFGFCVEFNFGGYVLQASNLADCTKFCVSPCNSTYSSIDSYMVPECFEKYGGVPSREQQKEINLSKELESFRIQNYNLQDTIDSKQSELLTAWIFFGISLCFNIGFILEKIIPLLRKWYNNKTGNAQKTTKKEENHNQNEETKNEEPGDRDNLLEQQNTSDFQETSSAVQASEETVITFQDDVELAKEFHDKRSKPPIGQNFMKKAFDNLTPSQ